MTAPEMHFIFVKHRKNLVGRFNTEYQVDDHDGNQRRYRRFNVDDQGLLNFEEWNQFEIWTEEIEKNEFSITFKINDKIVAPLSSNGTFLSKIVPSIYDENIFVYVGPGTPDIEFFPGKIRHLTIKTQLYTTATTRTIVNEADVTAAAAAKAVKDKIKQRECITKQKAAKTENS